MTLPTETIQAIIRAGSAQPEEVMRMALEILNRRMRDEMNYHYPAPIIRKVRVCLQPIRDTRQAETEGQYGCKILDDETGEERWFDGYYGSELDAIESARMSVNEGEEQLVGVNDCLEVT
jgi:hypothetical protein